MTADAPRCPLPEILRAPLRELRKFWELCSQVQKECSEAEAAKPTRRYPSDAEIHAEAYRRYARAHGRAAPCEAAHVRLSDFSEQECVAIFSQAMAKIGSSARWDSNGYKVKAVVVTVLRNLANRGLLVIDDDSLAREARKEGGEG